MLLLLIGIAIYTTALAQTPKMMYGDTDGTGVPYSKDPVVIKFGGRYLMYFSIRKLKGQEQPMDGWNIGIAESTDLTNWKKIGEIHPAADYETNGLCAPGALVKDGTVHLFYQTYGNGPKDAICHATSTDGIRFTRDASNPIFHPAGTWTNGRAIDAEVYYFKDQYFLYFATRDPAGKIQKQGVAIAPKNTDFRRSDWKQATDASILEPTLPWEGQCVEGASVIRRGNELYMFYAGSYNNKPQQIGVAKSQDGITWKRLSDQPFLPNGKPGEWNSSESGHPCIYEDTDGKTYLFFQGNNDNGKTWYLSNVGIGWTKNGPFILK